MSIDFEGLEQREENPTHGDLAWEAIAKAKRELAEVLKAYHLAGVVTPRLLEALDQVDHSLEALRGVVEPDRTFVLHEAEAKEAWQQDVTGYDD